MLLSSPTDCHSQKTSQISKLSIHTMGYTCWDTNPFLTKIPRLFPSWQGPPISTSKTGLFFCQPVTKSSHPALVREREIYWKRRWNWKQQMSESVTERNLTHAVSSEQVVCCRLTDTAPTVSSEKKIKKKWRKKKWNLLKSFQVLCRL